MPLQINLFYAGHLLIEFNAPYSQIIRLLSCKLQRIQNF